MSVVSTDSRVFKQARSDNEGRAGQWAATARVDSELLSLTARNSVRLGMAQAG